MFLIDEYSPQSNNFVSYRGTAVFAFLIPFRAQHKNFKLLRSLGASPHASNPERERYREL